jgi:protease-4
MDAQSPAAPQQIVIQQPGGMFGRFGKFLWIALIISVMFNVGQRAAYESYFIEPGGPINEKYFSLSKEATDKIAIIRVEGTIFEGNDFVKQQIDRVREDESVKAVVLRVNSPGGTVTMSDYLYHHLVELKKDRNLPIVVSMGSLCASGGYYIAMAVGDEKNSIYAEPTTWTGSIGVIIPHYDLSGLLESWHVADDSIVSGPLKQMGSPTQKMSEKEREVLQTLVDSTFDRFKDIVRKGRPAFEDDDAALDEVATGQIFTAPQALANGLVDKIGFLEDAVSAAATMAQLDEDNVRAIRYTRVMPGLIETLGGIEGQAAGGRLALDQLLDLTAPRAYYLSTWLPAVLRNKSQLTNGK